MTDVAERISSAIGKTVRYVNVKPEERRRALLAAGISPVFADALNEQTSRCFIDNLYYVVLRFCERDREGVGVYGGAKSSCGRQLEAQARCAR